MNESSKCPKCKSLSKVRMKRIRWAKYVYAAKSYACDNCNKRYTVIKLLFFWKLSI